MKNRLLLLPFLLLLGAAPAGGKLDILERHGRSFKGTFDGFSTVVLRGTHRERGEAHGRLLAAGILSILDEALIPAIHKIMPNGWQLQYVKLADRFAFPARYEEELAGMIDGIRAALPDKEDRLLKSLNREIGLADLKALNCLSDILGGGCSSFSAWGARTADGAPIVGRNLDYYAFPVASKAVLLAVEPAEKDLKATIDVLMPGFIGVTTAMNSDGAFLALHDEKGLQSSTKSGWVPRSLALRTAIETATGAGAVNDIAAALKGLPVRMGNNIHVVGTAGPTAVLEWDGNAKDGGVTVRGPEGRETVVCTNHYCLRNNADPGPDSGGRYTTVSQGVDAAVASDRKLDLDAAKKILDSVGRSGFVVTHLSYVGWPAARRIAFAVSPKTGITAGKGRWITLEWSDVFAN